MRRGVVRLGMFPKKENDCSRALRRDSGKVAYRPPELDISTAKSPIVVAVQFTSVDSHERFISKSDFNARIGKKCVEEPKSVKNHGSNRVIMTARSNTEPLQGPRSAPPTYIPPASRRVFGRA